MKRDLFDKEQVLAAIKGSMGIISKIAHNLDGCAWGTANKYVNRWAETRAAGFTQIDCFWRWMNFAGWVAVKE